MKVDVNKVRNFLSDNKIFFEVIVASLLSFMAVYVSIQANIIAQNQTEIMKEENLPQLEIRMTQEYNEEIKLYDNKAWLFFNRGGRLSDFDTKEYSFLKFIHRPDYDTLLIPLYNYIDTGGVLTGDSEGLVYQVENNHQGKKEVEIRDSLSSLGFYNIEVYVAVSYSDIFDDHHIEYFQISPRIIKIKKNEWEKIESHFQNAKDRFTLSNLNAKTIINMRKNLRQ